MDPSTRVTRRLFGSAAIAAALLIAGGACAPAAPQASTSAPAKASTAGEAKPAVANAWDQVVAAAKQEGKIVILGPPGSDARDGLVKAFQAKFPEIQVDYTGASGSQAAPKLLGERNAGLYAADLYIGGTTTALESLVPAGAIDPIHPYVVGPDADPSKWMGGEFDFSDDEQQYNLVFSTNVKTPLAYNPQAVSPDELKSWKDLLNPKWKGRMVMRSPFTAGPGLATATFWFTTDSLGKDYMRQLMGTGIVLSTDDRQMLDWVARGQYDIAVSASELLATEMQSKNLPVELLDADALEEGSYLTAGFGSVAVINRQPNPNATKVYLNWLLSKEGQLEWSKGAGYTSRRMDVPRDHLNPSLIPQENSKYQANYKEPYVRIKADLDEFLTSIRPPS